MLIAIMMPPTELGLEQGLLSSSLSREGRKTLFKKCLVESSESGSRGSHINLDPLMGLSSSIFHHPSPALSALFTLTNHFCPFLMPVITSGRLLSFLCSAQRLLAQHSQLLSLACQNSCDCLPHVDQKKTKPNQNNSKKTNK